MRRDHFGFAVFIIFLILAPKLPIDLGNAAPDRASLSLGAVGIVFWFFISNDRFTDKKSFLSCSAFLCYFALYALCISIASLKWISVLYACQYFFYAIGSWVMLGSYLLRVVKNRQTEILYNILFVIGLVYAIGVIISVWAGPIYPHQVLWHNKNIDNFTIPRGVGFAEGTNTAGAVLLVFSALLAFQSKLKWRPLLLTILLSGLVFTYSRSAILSFYFGVLGLWVVDFFCVMIKGRFKTKMALKACALCCGFAIIYFIGAYIVPPDTKLKAVAESFGIGDDIPATQLAENGLVEQMKKHRTQYWQAAINSYLKEDTVSKLFGAGFRQSCLISKSGSWLTPHNWYLAILFDFGLVGSILFIVLFATYFIQVTKLMVKGDERLNRGCIVAITGLLLMNLTETYLYSPVIMAFIMFLFELHNKAVYDPDAIKKEYFSTITVNRWLPSGVDWRN